MRGEGRRDELLILHSAHGFQSVIHYHPLSHLSALVKHIHSSSYFFREDFNPQSSLLQTLTALCFHCSLRLATPSCVTSEKPLNLSVPQFHHL